MEVPSLTFVVTNSLLISIHSSSISSSFCGKRFLGSQTPHYLLSVGRRPQNTHARVLLSTPPKMWPVILSEVGGLFLGPLVVRATTNRRIPPWLRGFLLALRLPLSFHLDFQFHCHHE